MEPSVLRNHIESICMSVMPIQVTKGSTFGKFLTGSPRLLYDCEMLLHAMAYLRFH